MLNELRLVFLTIQSRLLGVNRFWFGTCVVTFTFLGQLVSC